MRRFLSVILAIALSLPIMVIFASEAHAFPGNYFWFPNNMHVRIYHPSSGMYLGIERDGNEVNGARLQLQRYEEGNQNQIFYLKAVSRDSNGRIQYQIRVHGESEMVIEIRNSSHDDWAEAAQWTTHDGNCAKWYFFTETNRNGFDSATCCIKNVESGKMLNVPGNEAYDGNNLIQYHEDGTQAEIFQVFSVENDIIGAMWSRNWGKNNNGGIMAGQSEQQWYLIEKAFEEHSKVRIEIYYLFDAGMWGVSCKAVVNDQIDTYWNGSKSVISSSVNMNYSGTWVEGSVEYFYK